MPTGSGLSAQLMMAAETTYGTWVTPNRTFEFISESLTQEIERVESSAIRADARLMRSDDWVPGIQRVTGDIELELSTKNWAFLFGHMLGGTVITTGAGPFVHTYNGPASLTGKSLSIQVGRPSIDGVVRPFSIAGCKIPSWELSAEVGTDPVPVTLSIDGKSETTATALATPAYTASNNLFAFTHGAVTVGGASVPTRSITLSCERPMNTDRYYLGQATKSEPIENDRADITGDLALDFTDLTQYNRFTGATEAAVVLTFTRGADAVQFTMNCRFDGTTPEVGGYDILEQPVPFKVIASTTDASGFSAAITSSEATP